MHSTPNVSHQPCPSATGVATEVVGAQGFTATGVATEVVGAQGFTQSG